MAHKPEEFSFSPRSRHNPFKSQDAYQSGDLPDSLLSSPRGLIEHLELKKERHEALRNYYLTIISQLKDFTKVSLKQLEEQKNGLIEEVEAKFRDAVKEVKKRAFRKENELKSKLEEASQHFEQVLGLIERLIVAGNTRALTSEAEENLKVWAAEVDVTSSHVLFPVPSLMVSLTEYSEFKNIGKQILISSLVTENSPLQGQGAGKAKLFVPFGVPEYSCYYLLSFPTQTTCQTLVSALASYFNNESLALAYKIPPIQIQLTDKLHSNKELYLLMH